MVGISATDGVIRSDVSLSREFGEAASGSIAGIQAALGNKLDTGLASENNTQVAGLSLPGSQQKGFSCDNKNTMCPTIGIRG